MAEKPLDPNSRQKILSGYDKAKQHDPDLTPADYMWAVPEMRKRFKNKSTAGAYFRVLKQGRRSGGEIYREASKGKEKGLYQIEFTDKDGHRIYSQNLSVANAESEFDIASIDAQLQDPKEKARLKKVVADYKRRYGAEARGLSATRWRVRQVVKQQQPVHRMKI